MFDNGWDDWRRTTLRRLLVTLALLAFGALAVVGDALGPVA